MKSLTVFSLVLFAAAPLLLAAPAMVVDFEQYDFGSVLGRTTLYHSFWVKSVGTDTLRIEDIKIGCDCAMLPLETNALAPGDSMKLRFTWTTERARGLDRRFPRIFTNASPDPYRLRYLASCVLEPDSVRPVSINPYRFEFARMGGVLRDTLSFTMTNKSDVGYAVHLVSPPCEQVEVTFPDTLPPNSSGNGRIRVKPGYSEANFEETLTFQFDSRGINPARFSIPIRQRLIGGAPRETSQR